MKRRPLLIPVAVSAALGFLHPATAAGEHDHPAGEHDHADPAEADGHDHAADESDHADHADADGHDHAEADHGADEHDHADHADADGHDHTADEHDHADHADADGHDHAGHDHAGHDHAGHDHAGHAEKISGPNGGRVFTDVEPHLEFFVTGDRKVRITPVDDEGGPVEPQGQVVRLVGVDRLDPTRMSFEKDGGSLISDKAFPAGNNFPVVVLIQAAAGAPVTYEKFNLNLSECPECGHAEYACTCAHDEHDHDDHAGHDH